MTDPYKTALTYESVFFTLRLVEESDASDLLKCYSDPKSAPIFNSDNCTSDFIFNSEEEMLKMIQFWLSEYKDGGYVRFSIVDQMSKKAIGTIELFARKDKIGMLRLDLASAYEKDSRIQDILRLIETDVHHDFELKGMMTKIVSDAKCRYNVFKRNGYQLMKDTDDYYIKYYEGDF